MKVASTAVVAWGVSVCSFFQTATGSIIGRGRRVRGGGILSVTDDGGSVQTGGAQDQAAPDHSRSVYDREQGQPGLERQTASVDDELENQSVHDHQEASSVIELEGQGVYDQQTSSVIELEGQGVYDQQTSSVVELEGQGVYDQQTELSELDPRRLPLLERHRHDRSASEGASEAASALQEGSSSSAGSTTSASGSMVAPRKIDYINLGEGVCACEREPTDKGLPPVEEDASSLVFCKHHYTKVNATDSDSKRAPGQYENKLTLSQCKASCTSLGEQCGGFESYVGQSGKGACILWEKTPVATWSDKYEAAEMCGNTYQGPAETFGGYPLTKAWRNACRNFVKHTCFAKRTTTSTTTSTTSTSTTTSTSSTMAPLSAPEVAGPGSTTSGSAAVAGKYKELLGVGVCACEPDPTDTDEGTAAEWNRLRASNATKYSPWIYAVPPGDPSRYAAMHPHVFCRHYYTSNEKLATDERRPGRYSIGTNLTQCADDCNSLGERCHGFEHGAGDCVLWEKTPVAAVSDGDEAANMCKNTYQGPAATFPKWVKDQLTGQPKVVKVPLGSAFAEGGCRMWVRKHKCYAKRTMISTTTSTSTVAQRQAGSQAPGAEAPPAHPDSEPADPDSGSDTGAPRRHLAASHPPSTSTAAPTTTSSTTSTTSTMPTTGLPTSPLPDTRPSTTSTSTSTPAARPTPAHPKAVEPLLPLFPQDPAPQPRFPAGPETTSTQAPTTPVPGPGLAGVPLPLPAPSGPEKITTQAPTPPLPGLRPPSSPGGGAAGPIPHPTNPPDLIPHPTTPPAPHHVPTLEPRARETVTSTSTRPPRRVSEPPPGLRPKPPAPLPVPALQPRAGETVTSTSTRPPRGENEPPAGLPPKPPAPLPFPTVPPRAGETGPPASTRPPVDRPVQEPPGENETPGASPSRHAMRSAPAPEEEEMTLAGAVVKAVAEGLGGDACCN